jgi:hypothetical protein
MASLSGSQTQSGDPVLSDLVGSEGPATAGSWAITKTVRGKRWQVKDIQGHDRLVLVAVKDRDSQHQQGTKYA